ncbi:hypothetical protein [Peromfec virus RodF7_5]|uniref:Uncharacterized protein n=1 Tax=Peromfec virus RodF7_5 TaxID=2929354 RepID=A0A976R7D7_9VIRU|nr:hypothetical protein [Peromfec virus RodF7_5]
MESLEIARLLMDVRHELISELGDLPSVEIVDRVLSARINSFVK